MTTNANDLANEILKKAVKWLNEANDAIDQWKGVQSDAENAANQASSAPNAEERKLWEYKANADSHMADVGLAAAREIQRAALEELSGLQGEFFVKDVVVEEPSGATASAHVDLMPGRYVKGNHRFWWKAGGVDLNPNDNTWVNRAANPVNLDPTQDKWAWVEITANRLPFGDTRVEVLLGEDSSDPLVDPWRHI